MSPMKINAKYVNPFIEAAMKVVQQITGIEVRRGHLSYKAQVEPSYGVSIIIGMYGFLVGQVVYSLDNKLAERMVDRMLEGKFPAGEEDPVRGHPRRGGQHDHGQRHGAAEPAQGPRPEHHHPRDRHRAAT